MGKYAAATSVSVEKSRAEIESILERYGSDQFSYGRDDQRGLAVIQFRSHDRHIQFVLKLPKRDERKFTHHKQGLRTEESARKLWEQACRQKWRALALCIKAKLEAVESEISEFEEEFMAHIVLPGGLTVSQVLRPKINEAYLTGEMPDTLLALPSPEEFDG